MPGAVGASGARPCAERRGVDVRGAGDRASAARPYTIEIERSTPCPAEMPERTEGRKIHHRVPTDCVDPRGRETNRRPPTRCHPGESRGPSTRASGIWAPAFAGATAGFETAILSEGPYAQRGRPDERELEIRPPNQVRGAGFYAWVRNGDLIFLNPRNNPM